MCVALLLNNPHDIRDYVFLYMNGYQWRPYAPLCSGQCPHQHIPLQTSAELQSLLHLIHCPLSRACPIVSLEDYLGPKPRGGRKLICFFFYSTPFLFLCLNPNSNNVQPLGKWSDRNYPTMCSSLEIQDDISKWVIKDVSEWVQCRLPWINADLSVSHVPIIREYRSANLFSVLCLWEASFSVS